MDTLRQFPLAWLLACSLLVTTGCAYNKAKTTPAPQPAPAPVVTKPSSIPPTAGVKLAPKPEVEHKPKVEHKPVITAKPHAIRKPVASKSVAPPPPKAAPPEQPAQTTLAPKAPVTPAPQPVETLHIALAKLPISIHDQWVVDLNQNQCLLKSTPLKMDDGQGGTQVTFLLTPGSLEFMTKSDIDPGYKGTGIRIDDSQTFALESVAKGTNVTFNKQRKALLSDMQTGHTLQLTLGFWPTWPVTHTYSVTFPLANFGTAIQAWETCNQLLKSK